MDIGFEPVTEADLPMLADWLSKPHVREWWGEPAEELTNIRAKVEGRDTTRPFIFHVDSASLGYIQAWTVGDNQTPAVITDAPWVAELPSDAVGVDLLIGDPARLGAGVGTAVLKAFAAKLAKEGARHLIIDPDPANHRAVRAYEKAGFRPVERLLGKTGDSLIMELWCNTPLEKEDK